MTFQNVVETAPRRPGSTWRRRLLAGSVILGLPLLIMLLGPG
jgi:hypothetical protein